MTLPKLLRLLLLFLAAWVCAIVALRLPIAFYPGPTTNLYPIHSHGKYGSRKYGYVNQTGKLVVPPQFDDAREFFEGFGSVRVDGKWGAIDLHGKTIVPIEYDRVGRFSEGMVPVQIEDKWGFANTHGELSIPPQFDGVGESNLGFMEKDEKVFSEGLASVQKYGKWGFIDRQGKQVIPCYFDEVTAFSKGVSKVRSGDYRVTIDTQGEWIRIQDISDGSYYFDDFFQGIRIESNKERPEISFYRDRQNKIIGDYLWNPPKLAREFQEGLAIVREPYRNQKRRGIDYPIPAHTEYALSLLPQKCGFQDETGQVAIDLKFDQCRLFREGLAAVKVKDKWGYVDRTGEFIAPPQFDYADDFSDGRALVISKGKYSFIDSSGQLIVPFQFNRLERQDSWLFSSKPQFGEPDFDAKILEFDSSLISNSIEPHRFNNGFAKIIQDDKCGYIDLTGKIAIPIEFTSCSPFDEYGIAQARRGSEIPESVYLTQKGKIFTQNLDLNRQKILVSIFGFLLWIIAISVHEFGHAIVAYWGGDKSVKEKGYLSFNPIKYFNPIMSVILPGFAFAAGGFVLPGAAVYIEEEQLRNRFWKSAMAAAGPMGSALFGLLLVPVFHFSIAREAPFWISGFLAFFIVLQGIMTLFNLIPIPPLDGFRVIYAWFPSKWQNQTLFGLGSLMGLIFIFILPLFVSATAIVFNPIVERVAQITFFLGIPGNWVLTGVELFDRTYTASFLLVVGLVYLSYKPKPILKATGTFLAFIVLIADSCVKVKNQSERSENLLIAFDKCLKLNPDNSWLWKQRGRNLQKLNRYEEALTTFEKALELDPKDILTWGTKGWSLQQLNRHEEAITIFEKFIELDPLDFRGWRQKGWSLQKLSRYEESLTALEKAIELNPKDSWAWGKKGFSLQRLKRHEEALTALEKSLELDPKNAWAWGKKGWNLQQLNRDEESLTALEKALELDPNDAWAWGTKGFSLQQLNRHEEALAAFEKSLELDPNDAWDWGKKGWNLQKLNRHQEALTAFEKYIQGCDRELGSDAFLISDVFEGYQGAIVCCEKVLQFSPENALAWGLRGWALQELGCYDAAICSYDMALEYQSDTQQVAEIWNLKGICFDRLKRYPEALESYRHAIDKAIELELPAKRLQYFQSFRGLTLFHLNRRKEAVEAYLQSQGMNPSSMQRPDGNLIEIYKP